jgi:hypothetical protein
MQANLAIRSLADAPHLRKAPSAVEQAAWSHLGYLSYTRAQYEYYAELIESYPEYELCLVGRRVSSSRRDQRPFRLFRT